MLFLPQDQEAAAAAAVIVEKVVAAEGRCRIVGWRDVPHDAAVVGRMAKAEQPIIRQVQCPASSVGVSTADMDRPVMSGKLAIRKPCRTALTRCSACPD